MTTVELHRDLPLHDRSVPRRRVNAGDISIDRRGRDLSAPAWLSHGFRPFFFGASVYAALALPLWLWMVWSGAAPAGRFVGAAWHAHEMIFGYLAAVIAGFVLTAVPNWTGRLPISGTPLAILFGLWLAGRVAVSTLAAPLPLLVIDLAFPALLAAAVWREVVAGGNWRNAPIALLISLFGVANLLHHLEFSLPDLVGLPVRLALATAAMLIALVGGRITPSFTRNWLARRRVPRLPASFGRLDRLSLGLVLAAALAWIVWPQAPATGWIMVAAVTGLLVRLSRWQGWRCLAEPLVAVLHVGYFWLAASLALIGAAILLPDLVPAASGLHALTAGAIATMTLAVMTRATRGHTGRPIEADPATVAIYGLVGAGALLRIIGPFLHNGHLAALMTGGALWSLAFALFAISYGPMLLARRHG